MHVTLYQFHVRRLATVVEIGAIRSATASDTDGHSTLAWARHAAQVVSVDMDPKAVALTQRLTARYRNVRVVHQDGLAFLNTACEDPVDMLYLDFSDDPAANLAAYRAAQQHMTARALILIDDCAGPDGTFGAGQLVIPAAREDGWQLVQAGYQMLLGRP